MQAEEKEMKRTCGGMMEKCPPQHKRLYLIDQLVKCLNLAVRTRFQSDG